MKIDSTMNPRFVLYNLVFGNLTDDLRTSDGKVIPHKIKQRMDALGFDMSEDEIGYVLFDWADDCINGLTVNKINMSSQDYNRYRQRKYGQFPRCT